jgi:hypothetical protein
MEPPVLLDFGHGRTAVSIAVDRPEDTVPAVEALGLGAPRPILVVVGGAAGLVDRELAELAPLASRLVRAAAAAGAAIVDGGTDAGVMRLLWSCASEGSLRRWRASPEPRFFADVARAVTAASERSAPAASGPFRRR